jgi:hypothetical protein
MIDCAIANYFLLAPASPSTAFFCISMLGTHESIFHPGLVTMRGDDPKDIGHRDALCRPTKQAL